MVNSIVKYVMDYLKVCYPTTEIVIAGGAARDAYLGRKCRDYDIFVHLGEGTGPITKEFIRGRRSDGIVLDCRDDMCISAHEYAETLSKELRNVAFDCSVIFSYSTPPNSVFGDFDERHYSVVKASYVDLFNERTEIDIIFTKSKDLGETLLSFDCNLNMCYLDNNYEAKYPMGEPTVLQFTGRPLSYSRIHKMLLIAKNDFNITLTSIQQRAIFLEWNNEEKLDRVIKEQVIFKDC